MTLIGLDEAANYIGMPRPALEKVINNGKELHKTRQGRRFVVDTDEIDLWKHTKKERSVSLSKEDFIKAFKFALNINYAGAATKSDFGSSRQRSITQSVGDWTQGALAEIAVSKFLKQRYSLDIQLDFRVLGIVVGQDITAVTRNKVSNPPRIRVSIKSGKQNGMFMIIPINELDRTERVSDYYIFVRVLYDRDFIVRLLRDHPDLKDMQGVIPAMNDITAQIVGYCPKSELERRAVPEAGINEEKYVRATGELKNSDADWQTFADML